MPQTSASFAGLVVAIALGIVFLIATAPQYQIVVYPLLRELDLESPTLGGLRFPLTAWAVAVGGRALVLTLRRQYPSAEEAARINDAAAWMGELAAQHSLIVAVTHASFRRQLSTRLRQTHTLRTLWPISAG